MKINGYKLTNTFLTKAQTVGMQWELHQGKVLKNTLTIWLDRHGNLRNTSSTIVPVEVYMECLDYFERNESQMLNITYQ